MISGTTSLRSPGPKRVDHGPAIARPGRCTRCPDRLVRIDQRPRLLLRYGDGRREDPGRDRPYGSPPAGWRPPIGLQFTTIRRGQWCREHAGRIIAALVDLGLRGELEDCEV